MNLRCRSCKTLVFRERRFEKSESAAADEDPELALLALTFLLNITPYTEQRVRVTVAILFFWGNFQWFQRFLEVEKQEKKKCFSVQEQRVRIL